MACNCAEEGMDVSTDWAPAARRSFLVGRPALRQSVSPAALMRTWLWVLLLFAAPPLLCETYLSEAEAVKIAIPGAVSVTADLRKLTSAERDALQSKSRLRFPESQYKFFLG